MATEEYSIGYNEGYQDGWNAALEPEPQAEKQEPAGYLKAGYYFFPSNPIPRSELIPRKEWVGLTDDDIVDLYCQVGDCTEWAIGGLKDAMPFAKLVEAKLKEKNT